MWPKNKKEQGSWQLKIEDYEHDMQLLREERDELKAWCEELESRQRQQVFNQQIFRFWECAIAELNGLKVSRNYLSQSLHKTSEDFLSYQQLYRDQKKQLLDYIDGFTRSYQSVDENYQQLLQIQHHSSKIYQASNTVGELSERLRLLSLNIAIESSHSEKQKLSDSVIAALCEMSDSSKQLSVEIAALSKRIELDSKLGESYFNTLTEGFIGFSQAISPLLKTADRCGEMLASLRLAVGNWAADDLLLALKTAHLLWKFGIYSQLLGFNSSSPDADDGLAGLVECLDQKSKALKRVTKIHASCQQLGKALMQKSDTSDSKELLKGLEKLEATSEQLFQAFEQLHQHIAG